MTDADARAHAAIRATLGACAQAGDARRADAYAACFTQEGVLELGERIAGRTAIRDWMAAPSAIPPPTGEHTGYVSHHLTTCRIALDGADAAQVRTYWLVITGIGLDHSGYYDDRFARVGDDWLIAHRRPRTLWISPDSLIAKAA